MSHTGDNTLVNANHCLYSFISTRRFFYLQDEPVKLDNLQTYLKKEKKEKPEAAYSTAAYASQTGKGLLFFAKTDAQKAHPIGIIKLVGCVYPAISRMIAKLELFSTFRPMLLMLLLQATLNSPLDALMTFGTSNPRPPPAATAGFTQSRSRLQKRRKVVRLLPAPMGIRLPLRNLVSAYSFTGSPRQD